MFIGKLYILFNIKLFSSIKVFIEIKLRVSEFIVLLIKNNDLKSVK